MRAAYAEAQTAALTQENSGKAVYTKGTGSSGDSVTVSGVIIKTEKANSWSDQAGDLPFDAPTDPGESKTMTMTFTYDANGALETDSVTLN